MNDNSWVISLVNLEKQQKLENIMDREYRNINGIIVVKDDTVIFEKYYNGFGLEDSHNVASVTKSVISALIGIAIDKGLLKSIDEKVLDFFPGYICKPHDLLKRTLTIRHLLTMTAPTALKSASSGNEALDRLRRQRNWVNFILDQLGKGVKPGNFYYSTSNIHLLSAIITRVTGMSAREFANKNLFHPLEIKTIKDSRMDSFSLDDVFGDNVSGWIHDPQGISTGGWGLTLSPRDMARFGSLYLNQGMWGEEKIISSKWIRDSIEAHSDNYGYLWWIIKEQNLEIHAALGTGGNGIWCIPEKNMIVTVVADLVRRPPDFMKVIKSIAEF